MSSRPRVVAYNVASVDGRLTIAPDVLLLHGDERWNELMGPGDPYEWLRAEFEPDVLLEGSGSFVLHDTEPVSPDRPVPPGDAPVVGEHFLPPDVVDVEGRRWFTVVDGRGRVELQFTEYPDPAWAGWHVLVIACSATPPAHLEGLRDRGIPYLVTGTDRVDLPAAVGELHDRLGAETIVSTGGGRLQGALLRAGVIDEIVVDVLPGVIGGSTTPSLFDSPPLGPGERPARLDLRSAESIGGGRVRLRYRVGAR